MRRRSLVLFLSVLFAPLGTNAILGYASCPPASLVVTIASSPSALIDSDNSQSPRVATLAARVRNTGTAPAQNVIVSIGDGTTPGNFPAMGTRSLEMLGPKSEARRPLGTLPAGATQTLFWPVRYPATENTAYSYTVWATADGGCGDSQIAALHVRAAAPSSANRIRPANGSLTVEPRAEITPGELVTVTITGFDLGAVGPGPEAVEDLWLQPVSNPNFDPSCLRLVGSEVRLKSIQSEPYRDRLYFSGIGSHNPPPNYSHHADDYVKYTFIGLRRCATQLQPYQQTAFGNGHQYNSDIGAINLSLPVDDRAGGLTLDSAVSPAIGGANTTLTYTIAYGNTSGAPLGAKSAPLLITAQVPQDRATYIPGSATCSAGCLRLWSTDDGQTFSASEPAPAERVNAIRWLLLEPIPAGQNPAGMVGFQAKSTVNGELCSSAQGALNENIAIHTDTACVNSATDLQILVSSSSTVRPGGALRYTITYRNNGPSVAEDIVITVTLPTEAQLVQSSPPPQSTSGQVLAYKLGALGPGAGGSLALQVLASPRLSEGTALINTVQIATSTAEAELANNSASFTTIVGSRAPQITATVRVRAVADAPPLSPGAGDTLEYSATIKNTGAATATNVLFVATPDPHTELLIGSLSTSSEGQIASGNAEGDGQIRIEIANLAPNASETIEFRVRLKDHLAPGVRRIRLQGIISSNELPDMLTDDPHTLIPDDPTDFYLGSGPMLKAWKSYSIFNDLDGNGLPSPGDILKYTVTIENLGTESANSVVLTDGFESQLTLVAGSVSSTQGDVLSGNEVGERFVRVSLGNVAPQTKITVTYRAGINPDISNALAFVGGQALLSSSNIPSRPSDDPGTPAEDDPTLTPVWNQPQLYIAQRAHLKVDANGDGLPGPGDTLSYAVTVSNRGNVISENAFFSSTPDRDTPLIVGSVRTSQGSVTSGNGSGDTTVGVALDPLPRNSQAQISFDVLIKAPSHILSLTSQSLVNVPNAGSFRSDDPATPALHDPTITPVGNSPFLQFTKSVYAASDDDRNGMVSAGELLEYVLTIINMGPQEALGLNLSDALGNDMRILEGSVKTDHGLIASGTRPNSQELLVSLGSLAAHGGRAQISFQVRLQNPLSDRTIANQAFVWSTNLSEQASDDPRTPTLGDPTALTAGEFFILCGDVDSDGDIDLDDARLVGQAALGAIQLTERQRAAADVAPPFGVIDARDATAIAEIAQGYRVRCPIRPPTADTALQALARAVAPLRVARFVGESLGGGRAVRFTAHGQGIQEISVRIFNLAGRSIFESDWLSGSQWEWRGLMSDGRAVANGVYLYLISVRGADGSIVRSRVQKLVILR